MDNSKEGDQLWQVRCLNFKSLLLIELSFLASGHHLLERHLVAPSVKRRLASSGLLKILAAGDVQLHQPVLRLRGEYRLNRRALAFTDVRNKDPFPIDLAAAVNRVLSIV